ncbi:unnamed protein product [Phytophthora fragariaefolia]|uniref:Unnamed protein product n=1 Tax=Phytophthora fragariaefolia TaxID=1490495 RepID=A0A9W6Y165_9STRA|nr:unnamed protein product [Phytophthora fragariaefolia]
MYYDAPAADDVGGTPSDVVHKRQNVLGHGACRVHAEGRVSAAEAAVVHDEDAEPHAALLLVPLGQERVDEVCPRVLGLHEAGDEHHLLHAHRRVHGRPLQHGVAHGDARGE